MKIEMISEWLSKLAKNSIELQDQCLIAIPKDSMNKIELVEMSNIVFAFLAGKYISCSSSNGMTFDEWADQCNSDKIGDILSELYNIMGQEKTW